MTSDLKERRTANLRVAQEKAETLFERIEAEYAWARSRMSNAPTRPREALQSLMGLAE